MPAHPHAARIQIAARAEKAIEHDLMTQKPHQTEELSPEKQALIALRKMRARLEDMERAKTEPIAVIGLGCRFPGGASTPEAFWRLLHEGRDAIQEVPGDRWNIDAYYDPDPDKPGKMYTRYGGFVDDVDRFEAEFFRISPREAASMDPQQRLLLEVTWEALERAGCSPDALVGSDTGIFVGISTNDYGQLLLKAAEQTGLDAYFGTGNALNASAGRLSYVLGFNGPCMAIDAACSSSLVAVHLACQSLRNSECQIAVAGGVNLVLMPQVTINFCRARMLAADGRCKTFDAAADGYVRGEGCGVVILKRLTDAVAAGDRILALIRGSAVNQDGRSGGFTAPNERAQQALIRKALSAARVEPSQVSYVEAHGTGTSLGDPIEIHAIAEAFRESRSPERPLVVGSVKTNIGHLEAASGIAGLIKVVLALQHREIPPHLHFKSLNPHIALDGFPLLVPAAPMAWQPDGARLAGVSSFGFTGTNAHVIVEEPPPDRERPVQMDRPRHLLTLSARNDGALREVARRYADGLGGAGAGLGDVCFTANAGRAHFDQRVAVVAETVDDVRTALEEIAATGASPRVRRGVVRKGQPPSVAFLFTGQGSQYAGMGRTLYETQPTFRRALDRCAEILRGELEQPLLSVLYPAAGERSPIDETAYTQPALFAIEYALSELWASWGVAPAAVLGHSVGEYVAACVAGVLSLDDALKLVAARGRLMQQLPHNGGMAAVFAGEARVRSVLADRAGGVAIAAINGPENTVIAGESSAVAAVVGELALAGIKSQRLAVSHAFHSPLVEPMLDELQRIASRMTPVAPRVAIVSGVTGALEGPAFAFDAAYWRRHSREAVRFADGISRLYAEGHRVFLEIGPAPTLLALAQRTVEAQDAVWLASLRKGRDDWDEMLRSLAELYVRGTTVDWPGFDRDYPRRKVDFPTYPFQRERHWASLPTQSAPVHSPAAPQARPGVYEVRWQPSPRPSRTPHASPPRGRWILLADRGGVARRVQDALRQAGEDAMLVESSATEAAWLPLIEEARSGSPRLAGVLHFSSLDADRHEDAADRVSGLAPLVQALDRPGRAGSGGLPPRLWIVTRGAQPAAAVAAPLAIHQAPVWALGRIVGIEHPAIWGGLIDLDPATPDDAANAVVAEVLGTDGEDHVAFRDGVRRVARLAPLANTNDRTTSWSGDATYLITGGLGALGLRVAQRLVQRGVRHLVLTGRSGLPPRDQWSTLLSSSGAGRQAAAVSALEQAGASVRIVRTDVGDRDDVARLLEGIRRDGPPLRGIVHAAGVAQEGAVSQLSPKSVAEALRPKVAGAWFLHEGTREMPLDLFVLFSSISSVWGSKGLGAYAAANHFLDVLAHHRHALGLPAMAINWGPWADGGMMTAEGERWLAQMGVAALDPAEALDAFEDLLGSGLAQATVAHVDWQRFIPVYEARARRSLVEHLRNTAAATNTAAEAPAADLRAMPRALREPAVEALMRDAVIQVLRVPRDGFDMETPLSQLGLDSLMAVELRNRVQRETGVLLPIVTFLDGGGAGALVRLVLEDCGGEPPPPAMPAISAGEAEALLGRLSELTDQEVEALLATMAGSQSDA